MFQQHERRPTPWPLLVSVGLHAVLFWFAWYSAKDRAALPQQPAPVQVLWIDNEPTPPAPVVAPPVPEVKPELKKPKAVVAGKTPQVAATPVEPPAQVSGTIGASDSPTAEVNPGQPQKPSGPISLTPRLSMAIPGLGNGEPGALEVPSGGRTLKNGPGEAPDPIALREYTNEQTQRRLNAELRDMVGDARQRSGAVSPYFSHLLEGMRDGAAVAKPKLKEKKPGETLRDVVGTWQEPASRFGKTGSPVGNPEDTRELENSGLGRTMNGGGPGLNANEQASIKAGMQSMFFVDEMVRSAQRVRLTTVLELHQDARGTLADTKFIQRSGDEDFDEYVLHLSRKVVRDRGETMEADAGTGFGAEAFRTTWKFTWEPPSVKVKLLRVVQVPN